MPDATQPIQPAQAATQTATAEQPKIEQKGDAAKPPEPSAAKQAIPKVYKGPSPLQKQHRDPRSQPDYVPVVITFLTGDYKGMSIDLGVGINEVSHSETREWESQESDSVRPGLNFKNISPRDISFSVTFFDLNVDISHLVENLKHMGEITGEDTAPPRLLIKIGDVEAEECVCTSFQDKYAEPLPGGKGFRRCDVDLSFRLIGGKDNPHALGGPLTSTPLADERQKLTQAEREKKAREALIEKLLVDCLGTQGSEALKGLLNADQQGDTGSISKLDANTFVQSAIGGVFNSKTLAEPALQKKLREDLALVLAQSTDGVGQTTYARRYAQALVSGSPAGLRRDMQTDFAKAKADYDLIVAKILSQELSQDSAIFDRSKNATATGRLFSLGACGLKMRRNEAVKLKPISKEDAKNLQDINKFLADKPSDDEIKTKFGLKTESQVRAVKNGQPYQTKDEFVNHASQNNVGLTGQILWTNFAKSSQPASPTP